MPVFAITGNLASGKSSVLRMLSSKGAHIFDIDKKIHRYYRSRRSPVYRKIALLFPEALRGGRVCRRRLAALVFSDPAKRKELESAVHPQAIKELLAWVRRAKKGKGIFVAEVPLLFEKKLVSHFDGVIVVRTGKNILIRRIAKKYRLSKSQALNRLKLYLPVGEKVKKADFVVDNNRSRRELKKEVDFLWRKVNRK
jgi:dephospho-CoA kinase